MKTSSLAAMAARGHLLMILVSLFSMCSLGDPMTSEAGTKQRCEGYSFVSLDAVGMSERPCWTVCPPVKTLQMHKRFCQKNCPEYFQECVDVPNVGQSVGSSGESTMDSHVTMKVFIIVTVVLSVVVMATIIVSACCLKCCINRILSKHCRCKQQASSAQSSPPKPVPTSRSAQPPTIEFTNDEAATLMIRSPEPLNENHQIKMTDADDDVFESSKTKDYNKNDHLMQTSAEVYTT